jgi:hypothetical protein
MRREFTMNAEIPETPLLSSTTNERLPIVRMTYSLVIRERDLPLSERLIGSVPQLFTPAEGED